MRPKFRGCWPYRAYRFPMDESRKAELDEILDAELPRYSDALQRLGDQQILDSHPEIQDAIDQAHDGRAVRRPRYTKQRP